MSSLTTTELRTKPSYPPKAPAQKEHHSRSLIAQILRYTIVGGASTVFYSILYVILRTFAAPLMANTLALLISTVANTAVNRSFTFGVRDQGKAVPHQVQGLLIFGLGLVLTSSSLTFLTWLAPVTSQVLEVIILIGTNALVTLLRFVLFRAWIFEDIQTSNKCKLP